jgi:hypothetical protein
MASTTKGMGLTDTARMKSRSISTPMMLVMMKDEGWMVVGGGGSPLSSDKLLLEKDFEALVTGVARRWRACGLS